MNNYKILLASGSPRRKQLLEELGLNFNVAATFEVDESFDSSMAVEDVAAHLSERKNSAYKEPLAVDEILLTADTVVIIAGKILGKPSSKEEAITMLQMLSNRTHKVITAITLRTTKEQRTVSTTTEVTFKELALSEIEWYVEQYNPLDKAGGYGAQEWIGLTAIEKYSGQYTNVVGLPTATLIEQLRALTGKDSTLSFNEKIEFQEETTTKA